MNSGEKRGLYFRGTPIARRISTYAETVEGSGFTKELSVPWFFSTSRRNKISVLKHALSSTPDEQGSHHSPAVCFAISLKTDNNDSRAKVSDQHMERLIDILNEALSCQHQCTWRGADYFRLWISNPSYERDALSRNEAAWESRKLEVYEWCEVICLESPNSPHYKRPWLSTERALSTKASGYWTRSDSGIVHVARVDAERWVDASALTLISTATQEIDAYRAGVPGNTARARRQRENCTKVRNYLSAKARSSGGVRIGKAVKIELQTRAVRSQVSDAATNMLYEKIAAALNKDTAEVVSISGAAPRIIRDVVGCGSQHWLHRDPETGLLKILMNPFSQDRSIYVVPHLASQSITSLSLTPELEVKFKSSVAKEIRDVVGPLDSVVITSEGLEFHTIPSRQTSLPDDRVGRDVAPASIVDRRNTCKYDRATLGILLSADLDENIFRNEQHFARAADVYSHLKGNSKSMYRERIASVLSATEAVLRECEITRFGIEKTDASAAQNPSGGLKPSHRRIDRKGVTLVSISWLTGIITVVCAFKWRSDLSADPISVLLAVAALNFVTATIAIRDYFQPSLSILEFLGFKLHFTERTRKKVLLLDERETVALLQEPVTGNFNAAISRDNLCFVNGSEHFIGETKAALLQFKNLPDTYSAVFTENCLPGIKGNTGITEWVIGESVLGTMHFTSSSAVVQPQYSWRDTHGNVNVA